MEKVDSVFLSEKALLVKGGVKFAVIDGGLVGDAGGAAGEDMGAGEREDGEVTGAPIESESGLAWLGVFELFNIRRGQAPLRLNIDPELLGEFSSFMFSGDECSWTT